MPTAAEVTAAVATVTAMPTVTASNFGCETLGGVFCRSGDARIANRQRLSPADRQTGEKQHRNSKKSEHPVHLLNSEGMKKSPTAAMVPAMAPAVMTMPAAMTIPTYLGGHSIGRLFGRSGYARICERNGIRLSHWRDDGQQSGNSSKT
jgi:hypothetical protein